MRDRVWYFAAALTSAFVFTAYELHRARKRQSSHQPIRLRKVRRASSGEIVSITLVFTYPRYAQAFAAANKKAISAGVLLIE
ncbi:MAG TPA: hypothetical protein VHK24_02190 [Steroidobacter sp.]|nr:hypothetical protein [Steroidobacter sp.]